MGVRPEAARFVDDGLPTTVMAVEYLGADTLLETRIGEHPFVVRVPGRTGINPSDAVHLAWHPAAVQWFDLASERRID